MPIYEYKCESCGEVFEVMQKFSDTPLSVHENCGGKVERLLSSPALQFKGSGWYVTDYGKGGVKPSGSNGAEKGEKKSDKPAKSSGASKKTESSSSTSGSSPKKDS